MCDVSSVSEVSVLSGYYQLICFLNYCCVCALSACVFNALTLLVGQQEGYPTYKKTEWWSAGMVICPERGADLPS